MQSVPFHSRLYFALEFQISTECLIFAWSESVCINSGILSLLVLDFSCYQLCFDIQYMSVCDLRVLGWQNSSIILISVINLSKDKPLRGDLSHTHTVQTNIMRQFKHNPSLKGRWLKHSVFKNENKRERTLTSKQKQQQQTNDKSLLEALTN